MHVLLLQSWLLHQDGLWRPVEFDCRASTGLGETETLQGHKQNVWQPGQVGVGGEEWEAGSRGRVLCMPMADSCECMAEANTYCKAIIFQLKINNFKQTNKQKTKTLCTPGLRGKEQWPYRRLSQTCLWVSEGLLQKCGLAVACSGDRDKGSSSPGRWWKFGCSVMSNSCDCMDCNLPGSSVHGILQARILEWVSLSFSRASSRPGNQTQGSCIVGRFCTNWLTREASWEVSAGISPHF